MPSVEKDIKTAKEETDGSFTGRGHLRASWTNISWETRSARHHHTKMSLLFICTLPLVNILAFFLQGITGEGAQCDDLAEGSELIKTLQARSALSKDRYIAETLDTYNQHNFKGKCDTVLVGLDFVLFDSFVD